MEGIGEVDREHSMDDCGRVARECSMENCSSYKRTPPKKSKCIESVLLIYLKDFGKAEIVTGIPVIFLLVSGMNWRLNRLKH